MVERIVLRRVNNSEELVLDMVSTPSYILKSVSWGTIQGTHHSYKYVNQIGESLTNTSLEKRPITIEGWVVAENKNLMMMLKNKLNYFINPQEAIELFYSHYVIEFVPDETVKYSTTSAENNEYFCKFQISGTAFNPLFFDTAESRFTFVNTVPGFHFPLVMSSSLPDKGVTFGKRSVSRISNAFNEGSVPVGMTITFKANGTVVNPSLINVNTQEKFLINKTLTSGEEVLVNTNIGEKSVRGKIGNGDYANYYMYKDIDSPWLQLEIGDNLFSYNAESGIDNLDVFVHFHNRYLEVEE